MPYFHGQFGGRSDLGGAPPLVTGLAATLIKCILESEVQIKNEQQTIELKVALVPRGLSNLYERLWLSLVLAVLLSR